MTGTLEKWFFGKWYVVCVKDARGYVKGQPMSGYFETSEDARRQSRRHVECVPRMLRRHAGRRISCQHGRRKHSGEIRTETLMFIS